MKFNQVKEITQKEMWENFLLGCDEKTFLSSWNWGEFNKMMGNKIWRLGIFECLTYDVKHLVAVAPVIKVEARRGTFLFVPHGPLLCSGNPKSEILNPKQIPNSKFQILNALLKELERIAKNEKVSFIRIAPIEERNEENIKIFKKLGFRQAPIHMHPEVTWELDIRPFEDELLMNMRKTTRYLIRQAQKNKDIEIIKSDDIGDIEKFNTLYQATVDRHHFLPFSLNYLKNEFLAFMLDNEILIFLGKYRGEIVSAGIFLFWQGIGFYHHGASSLKYPKIPVSYLLQWEAIKEAKKRGCQKFNFWGIAPTRNIEISKYRRHPWKGLTLFKMGFGGYKKEYVRTQDLVVSPKYWLNWIIEKIRKTKRGL